MADTITETRMCRSCGANKPLDDFHLDNRLRGGRRANCKACRLGALKARGRQTLPLLDSVDTEWGRYPRLHRVTIIDWDRTADGGAITVCLDDEGHEHGLCHSVVIPSRLLFVWPDRLDHGVPAGYEQHKRHLEGPCEACLTARTQQVRAKRLRNGSQAGIKVPTAFLAELLDSAPKEAWDRADQMWGKPVVDALLGSR